MAIFGRFDVFSSRFGSSATDGGPEIATCDLRLAGEEDGSDAEDAEIWSHGCLIYRPADPDADGSCQVVTARIGDHNVILASRDLRVGKYAPALNPGDCALVSTNRAAVIVSGNGSVRMFRSGETVDSYIEIAEDGALLFGNQWGAISLNANGFSVTLSSGQVFCIGPDGATLQAPMIALRGGGLMLGATASKPLNPIPLVGVSGGLPPILNIWV